MLVLSRKPGESIQIGPDVCITLVSINGTQAKLSIEAPSHIAIHRTEVYERIAEANRQAVAGGANAPERAEAAADAPERGAGRSLASRVAGGE